jgi:hypothetical protein
MRLAIPAIAALLTLGAPAGAPAQDLGRVLRPIVAPVDSLLRRGARRVLRPPAYRSRARFVRPSSTRQAVVQAQDQASQYQATPGQLAPPKPFWPDAPQNVFDFVLSSQGTGLWAHGYGAIVTSMLAQPPKVGDARSASLAASNAEQTTGTATAVDGEIVCGERSANLAEEATRQLGDTLALADSQQAIVAELRSALRHAEEDIAAACPRNVPATLPERLRAMQDRLWTMRVAITALRTPLQKFHDALTSDQKSKLDAQQPSQRESKKDVPSGAAARACYASAQLAPQWPADQIARAVRLNKDQQTGLATLNETSLQMSQLMMGACPRSMPITLARLDATLDWIDAMLFAGVNTAVAVDTFYGSLNDEQKARLDKIDL